MVVVYIGKDGCLIWNHSSIVWSLFLLTGYNTIKLINSLTEDFNIEEPK